VGLLCRIGRQTLVRTPRIGARAIEAELETTVAGLETTEAELGTTEAELETTEAELETTEAELETTEVTEAGTEAAVTVTALETVEAVIASAAEAHRAQADLGA
jgi:multidrug resistance efflux pump